MCLYLYLNVDIEIYRNLFNISKTSNVANSATKITYCTGLLFPSKNIIKSLKHMRKRSSMEFSPGPGAGNESLSVLFPQGEMHRVTGTVHAAEQFLGYHRLRSLPLSFQEQRLPFCLVCWHRLPLS